jgi:hypothetical protein
MLEGLDTVFTRCALRSSADCAGRATCRDCAPVCRTRRALAEFDVEPVSSNAVFVSIHELPPGSPRFPPHPHSVTTLRDDTQCQRADLASVLRFPQNGRKIFARVCRIVHCGRASVDGFIKEVADTRVHDGAHISCSTLVYAAMVIKVGC